MRLVLVLAITLGSTSARAHVAPSVDDNNRYLKLTPAADRVRLAYTVFFGEVPGAQLRPTLDTDRDGRIADAEAQRFGDQVAREVAAALDLTIDGATHPVTWTTVAVGMGTPLTRGGSFSVDMIAWACLPVARGKHAVQVRDRFRIPRPGETEVKVEDALGITVHHARIGTVHDPTHDYRFVGPGGPLADDGLDVSFTASAKAPLTADTTCASVARNGTGLPIGLLVGGGAAVVCAVATLVVIVRRRRA